jgi:hypothetical protein
LASFGAKVVTFERVDPSYWILKPKWLKYLTRYLDEGEECSFSAPTCAD